MFNFTAACDPSHVTPARQGGMVSALDAFVAATIAQTLGVGDVRAGSGERMIVGIVESVGFGRYEVSAADLDQYLPGLAARPFKVTLTRESLIEVHRQSQRGQGIGFEPAAFDLSFEVDAVDLARLNVARAGIGLDVHLVNL